MKLSGSQILIECLKREGVKVVFAYPGGVNLPVFDVLYDEKDLQVVLCRHEQGEHTWRKDMPGRQESRAWFW